MSLYRISIFAAFAALSSVAFATPVDNDLWEYTNSGFSIVSLSSPTICGDIRNAFGAALAGATDATTSCSAENAAGVVVLHDTGFADTVVEWNSALSNLTSFELNIAPDSPVNRTLDRLRLAYWNGSTYVQFFDSGSGAYPYGTNSFPVTLGSSVQSSRWQATFTNGGGSFPGARIWELDGFGSLVDTSGVPEPSSIGFMALGLSTLLLRFRRS
ncbi:MAG: PEP-CTERM sorting domain-containing protein [Acidobacteria bacterium]|nr:PEP-CTERM sorting domain-containing protein [Acidobacteriota bacterium]